MHGVNMKIEEGFPNYFCLGKQYVLHILSVLLYSSVFSMYEVCAVFSYVVCPSVSYFSTSPHERFGGGIIDHEICVLIFYAMFVRKNSLF